MNVFLTGGGTLGSVSPLLAVASLLQRHGAKLFFVGTPHGPERKLVTERDITFLSISAPKLRRYWSWRHILVPAQLIMALWQAWRLIKRYHPDVIVAAGGFVAAPLVWMGWLFRVPSIIHQLDLRPGLVNILIHLCATKITVSFSQTVRYFPANKTYYIGTPLRDLTPTTHNIPVDPKFPTVLIMGGGTGAQAINNLVSKEICEFANVIHVTGQGKNNTNLKHLRYFCFEFLSEQFNEAINRATLVVSRAGLGSIAELAALSKPAMVIPIPRTHQEKNAFFLQEQHAAVVLDQNCLTPITFAQQIKNLLNNAGQLSELARNIHVLHQLDATKKFANFIIDLAAK